MTVAKRRVKARPTSAAFEFGLRAKERQAAKTAAVDAGFLVGKQTAAKRRLGAVFEQDVGFLTREAGLEGFAFRRARRREVEVGGRRCGLVHRGCSASLG